MDFIWAGDREQYNSERVFCLQNLKQADKLVLCAVDFYRVFLDGKMVCFGPERTASGYAKTRDVDVRGAKDIVIRVLGHNFNCYECDLQLPFFGAQLYKEDALLYDSFDFVCKIDLGRKTETSRFSGQRGCVECYDFNLTNFIDAEIYSVQSPKILEGAYDNADYRNIEFDFVSSGNFLGFGEIKTPEWCTRDKYRLFHNQDFIIEKDFLEKLDKNTCEYNFSIKEEHSGFISLEINAEENTEVFLTFEELEIDGKWIFRRSACNDVVALKVKKGVNRYITEKPYTLRLLKILSLKPISVKASLITLENKDVDCVFVKGNEKIEQVFEAAKSTFRQNALDIFTDCPGRERAGWLCDSLFLSWAERLLTGKNVIEKRFLENFLIAETPEVPPKMIPKCFPSEHPMGHYMPTWAMWFIIEVEDYYSRTGDKKFIENAKQKIYDAIDFLDDFVNSDGLLEDLQGWVFVEWSACNNVDYVRGVNYPVNMLYAHALKKTHLLYGDENLLNRANKMQSTIIEQSFNGEFFVDNAIREKGKLVLQKTHLTETCQYYAMITGLSVSEEFKQKMITEFGPFRDGAYPKIERSNMIVGNLMRFFYLIENGEKERALKESVEHFYSMSSITGTLWEHNKPSASCNHGFASVAAVIIMKCLIGYQTVIDNVVKTDGEDLTKKYGVVVEFNYK